MRIKNQPMHAEISSSNASSGVALNIYPSGTFTAYTLDPTVTGDFLVVTDVTLSCVAGGLTSLFCDTTGTPSTVGAGEAIVSVTLPANGVITVRLSTPYVCQVGAPLVLIAPSGVSSCQVQGFIKANPNLSSYVTQNIAGIEMTGG